MDPKYIKHDGRVVFNPPYTLKGVDFMMLPVKGTRESLQQIIDQFLNSALQGTSIRYEVFSDYFLYGPAYMDQVSSEDLDGSVGEVDFGVWMPVKRVESGETKSYGWFLPYLFVDSPYAMATGREVFGFQKTMCQPDPTVDQWKQNPDMILAGSSCKTWGFQSFSPDAMMGIYEVVNLIKQAGGDNIIHEIENIADELEQVIADIALGGTDLWDVMKLFLSSLENEGLRLVFLKQYHAASNPQGACFQEIVEADTKISALSNVQMLASGYQLSFPHLASHPIAETTGMAGESQDIDVAMRVKMDFSMELGETIHRNEQAIKQKVAVLGGGLGSLTALATMVTHENYSPEDWDITVYERSWRLGGKGASGRNAQFDQRIEEHGIHIWLGFYDNAFKLITQAFESMGHKWEDYFTATDLTVFEEVVRGERKPWPIEFPTNQDVPGTVDYMDYTPFELLIQALKRGVAIILEMAGLDMDEEPDDDSVDSFAEKLLNAVNPIPGLLQKLLRWIENLFEKVAEELDEFILAEAIGFQKLLNSFAPIVDDLPDELRRGWILLGVGLATLIGMIKDDVFTKGFAAIDDQDFRAWYESHGASKQFTEGPLLQALYDLVFAYEQGDTNRPNLSAGAALYCFMRMGADYKGSIFWMMNMGMGDTIFTPLMELLKKKGVKFEFFQQIEEVTLTEDQSQIASVKMTSLVELADGAKSYDPYVSVKNLHGIEWPCWPSEPLYDQIDPKQAAQLKKIYAEDRADIESNWIAWDQGKSYELNLGTDYDLVICGLTKRVLQEVAKPLEVIPRWKQMIDNLATVTTQGGQFWFEKDVEEMGYDPGDPKYQGQAAVTGGYVLPMSTLADFSHLTASEDWSGMIPKYNPYCVGVMPMPDPPVPPSHQKYPKEAYEYVKTKGWEWLNKNAPYLWPNWDPKQIQDDRYQYWRPGINWTEHYVLSLPGTAQYRLGANDLGVKNLFLAGDWTYNVLNAACVESSTVSGMLCAKALTGWDIPFMGIDPKAVE